MRKFILAAGLAAVVVLAIVLYPKKTSLPPETTVPSTMDSLMPAAGGKARTGPVAGAQKRITKKPFGIKITPETSPVQPERFTGYHTGVDFEILPGELERDIDVKAVSDGRVEVKRFAGGYGGVFVVSGELQGQAVTFVYGHLRLGSIAWQAGDSIRAGDRIGVLGDDKSPETDGERKHLHFGIHRGTAVNIRGYVQKPSELSDWINPCDYFCNE